MREACLLLGSSLANLRLALAQDRHEFTLAVLDDIHARLFLLEQAVFGEGHEWFDLTPHPDDASIAAALYPLGWGEARRERERNPVKDVPSDETP